MSMCSICKTGYEESAQGVCPNCGANVAFQREARRLRGVTDFVKSWWLLMMISSGVLAWSQDGEHVGVAVSGMQNTLLVHEVSQMPRL
ncbi:MAG: hypothetical protein AAF635_11250 [Cyanobacteria bacterium P01_C01_bin.69]